MEKTIYDVREFWDSNPLLVGEVDEPVGSEQWYTRFDYIKTNDVFCGNLDNWIPHDVANKRILDVGCGPGYWNRLFGKMNCEYHGIDISPKTIELAKISQNIFNLHGTIKVGNAEKLEYPNGYFDYIVSEGVIHHSPDTKKCVDEIYRVLKPKGSACVGVYHKNLVLRFNWFFRFALIFLKLFNIALKGRGRDKMAIAKNSSDFVRMYDGEHNPIGKAYTKSELGKMFSKFSSFKFEKYYIPTRIININLPPFIHNLLSKYFGLMILIKVKK